MAQNNLKNYVSQMIHGMHVRKHRKLVLAINYYKGLASEYDHQDQTYLENRLKRIDGYFEDEVSVLKKRVDDVTRNDEKKEQAIKRYDEKAYWARRKYKTAEAKKALGQVLENMLQQYDQIAASKRQEFINQLDVKYPHQVIEDKRIYLEKIKKREDVKSKRKERISKIYQKRHESFLTFQKKNEKRLLELTHKADGLKVLIEQYNEDKLTRDEFKLNQLKQQLSQVMAQSMTQAYIDKKNKKITELKSQLNTINDQRTLWLSIYKGRKEKQESLLAQLNEKLLQKQKLKQDQLTAFKERLLTSLKEKNLKDQELRIQIQKLDAKLSKKEQRILKKSEQDILRITKRINEKLESIEVMHKKKLSSLHMKEKEINALIDYYTNKVYHQRTIERLENQIDLIQTTAKLIHNPKIHLAISNLKMYFGGVKAVNDLSFDVKKGEVFGLIGPNGAGKTTVFNCLTQFYKATGGNMVFRNKEDHLVNLYEKKTHDMIKEGIARSFQNVELIWELTVLDNLLVAAHSLLVTNYVEHMLHDRKMKREEKVLRTKGMQILTTLGIQDYAFRSPYGLPYGILKKIELARTLMTDPSLIILDEPAAGLNDAETLELAKIIKAINKDYGITIFLVEHDMGLVMSICDTICAISFGKMIGIGTPKEIQNNPEVRKAYLGDDSDE